MQHSIMDAAFLKCYWSNEPFHAKICGMSLGEMHPVFLLEVPLRFTMLKAVCVYVYTVCISIWAMYFTGTWGFKKREDLNV